MPEIIWTDEKKAKVQEVICIGLASGRSLKNILETEQGMPSRQTVYQWLMNDASFSDNYTRAREAQADYYADEIADIADTESDPNKARVRIDARKWAAGKLKPKVYGDRLQLDGDMNVSMSDAQLDARLAKLLGKAGAAGALGGEGTA
ncbi:MAG: hypothetical protein ACRCV5_22205 [Afipia sp.]